MVNNNLLSSPVENESPESEHPDDAGGAHDHQGEDGDHEVTAGGGVELGRNFSCNEIQRIILSY